MKRRDAIKRLAGTGAMLALPAFSQPARIVLGQSAAFSGPSEQLGIQMNRGARIHFDALNAAGGINGRLIELRTLDDGYEPARCAANTEKFLKDDVFALFGYVGTPTCMAALPMVEGAKIPFFGPFTGAESLRSPFKREIFHVRASYYDETALIVRQLTALGLRRVAVFYQDDAYGQAGLEGVKRALKRDALEPVSVGTVERNSADVRKAVADICAAGPNAVIQIGSYKACAAFVRVARKAGYGGTFSNVSFVGTQALLEELGPDARGVMVSQVMPSPFSRATALAREYQDALVAAGPGNNPNYSSIEGFLAAKVLTEGIRRAGKTTSREGLVVALESIRGADFGGFNIDFGPSKHWASNFVELSMLTQNGKVRL
jgi:branched-chain amino acid transport system substrate-binding protein